MGLLHASILSVLPDVRVVAVCEKSWLVSNIARKILRDIAIVRNLDELKQFTLDAVYITTPPSTHFTIANVLYSKKITNNIFIEKPLTTTYKEAAELSEIATQCGGANMVGFNKRFAVTFKKAKKMLVEQTLGDVTSFSVQVCSSDFFGIKRNAKQGMLREGVLLDLGCHAIDMSIWLLGDLTVTSSELSSQNLDVYEDTAIIKVKTRNNVPGTFNISWLLEGYRTPRTEIEIACTKGAIKVNEDNITCNTNGQVRTFHKHDLNDSPGFFLGETDYYLEDSLFLDAVSTGKKVDNNIQFAAKTNEFIDAAKTGVWVDG